MANTFSAAKPQFWQDAFQTLWKPMSVYGQIAESFSDAVKGGDRVHRPTTSNILPQNIILGTDMSPQDVTTTDEYILVDKNIGMSIGIDRFDQKQTNIDLMKAEAMNMTRNLNNAIDADVQYLITGASSNLDASTLTGGTAGVPVTAVGSNVYDIITTSKYLQFNTSAQNDDAFCVLDPKTFALMELNGAGRETLYGDQVWKDGFTGRAFRFQGVDFYESLNYTRSRRLDYSGQPSNGETLVFTLSGAGFTTTSVTVTFVSSIGSTAGNVLIGADADATYANLVGLLNNPGTTSSTQVALSAANQLVMRPVVASQDATGNTVTVFVKGFDFTITDGAANVSENTAYAMKRLAFGKKKQSLSLAIQTTPSIEINPAPLQFRKYVLAGTEYGTKMFTDGAQTSVQILLTI